MDRLTPEKRNWNMSRIKRRDTKTELLVRSLLHRMGFRFKISDKSWSGRPDIFLPKFKAAIFVHGCCWHRHAGCKYSRTPTSRAAFWNNKFEQNMERDRKNIVALKKSGWRPIIVWECEIKADAERTVPRISAKLMRYTAKAEAAA